MNYFVSPASSLQRQLVPGTTWAPQLYHVNERWVDGPQERLPPSACGGGVGAWLWVPAGTGPPLAPVLPSWTTPSDPADPSPLSAPETLWDGEVSSLEPGSAVGLAVRHTLPSKYLRSRRAIV